MWELYASYPGVNRTAHPGMNSGSRDNHRKARRTKKNSVQISAKLKIDNENI